MIPALLYYVYIDISNERITSGSTKQCLRPAILLAESLGSISYFLVSEQEKVNKKVHAFSFFLHTNNGQKFAFIVKCTGNN